MSSYSLTIDCLFLYLIIAIVDSIEVYLLSWRILCLMVGFLGNAFFPHFFLLNLYLNLLFLIFNDKHSNNCPILSIYTFHFIICQQSRYTLSSHIIYHQFYIFTQHHFEIVSSIWLQIFLTLLSTWNSLSSATSISAYLSTNNTIFDYYAVSSEVLSSIFYVRDAYSAYISGWWVL